MNTLVEKPIQTVTLKACYGGLPTIFSNCECWRAHLNGSMLHQSTRADLYPVKFELMLSRKTLSLLGFLGICDFE